MSDSSEPYIKSEDISSTSFTSSACSEVPLLVNRNNNRWLVAVVIVTILIFIWGVASLPAIFYVNELPSPKEQHMNMSVLPLPVFPCNNPLVWNEKNKMCEPRCAWVQFSHTEAISLKVVDNFSISVSLLGFIVILATWIRIKQLRAFPHIIPLYIQGLSAVICFLIAVSNGMGGEKAFCSSEFLSVSLANPTMFCKVQGILMHYCYVALALWFLVYTINLVQMVYSDSLVSLRGHRNKLVHIVSSLICWLFPFVPIGIVLGSKTTSYAVVNLRFCYPNGSDIAFFTTPFIIEVAQGVGCTCLLVVVYKLFMLRAVSMVTGEQAELRQKKMMKVVKRLVFLMFAYAAIMALAFTPLSVLQRHAKLLEFYIKQYFGCLMFFTPPKCPKTYQKYTFTPIFIVSYLTSAFFALTTMFFLAFNKQSRKLWTFWWKRLASCCCGEPTNITVNT